MKNALVLRYDGSVFAIRMSKVLEHIIDSGYKCDVAVPKGRFNKIVNVSAEMGRDLSKEIDLYHLDSTVNHKYKSFFIKKFGLPEMWDPLFYKNLKNMIKESQYDLIVCKDTKSLKMVFKAIKYSGKDIPVICDMYENCIYQLRDKWLTFGSIKTKLKYYLSFIEQKLRYVENKYLVKCKHVFVVVEEAKNYLLSKYPQIKPENISVVHNCEQINKFDSIPEVNLINNDDQSTLFSYVGSVRSHRGIDFIINAVDIAKDNTDKSFKVIIIGAKEDARKDILNEIKSRNLEAWFYIGGFVSHVEAMQWIKYSDVGLIPHKDTPFIRTTIPNKIFQYMTAGKAVIVSDIPPLNRIVNEEGCGYTVDAFNAKEFSKTIIQILDNKDIRIKKGQNGRESALKKYDWTKQCIAYKNAFTLA